jgi:phosphoglycerate kinase
MRLISDLDVAGRTLLVRADLNVPMNGDTITDATRIDRFAIGMRDLLARGARLVILSHFGRPNGRVVAELSLRPLVAALSDALGVTVRFCSDCHGGKAGAMAGALANGEAMLCENLRFDRREEANDAGFAARLARLGQIYVNDAFPTAHRAHASTVGIAALLPATAGPLMHAEITALGAALETPKHPAVAIVGGAKVSSKIAVLKNLVTRLDAVIIGGGMANTFLFAHGAPMGRSLFEADQLDMVHAIETLARRHGCRILLPVDVVCARAFRAGARPVVKLADQCPEDMMILDAGPKSAALFNLELADANTILWNGPLGAFEIPPFDQTTTLVAETVASLSRHGLAVAIAGGGDTVAALNNACVAEDFTYVSSAGGAFLEWLEGRMLPGISALTRAEKAA